MRRSLVRALIVAGGLLGCGAPPAPPPPPVLPTVDAGVVQEPFAVTPPQAPQPAQLPRMTPCPQGWRAVGEAPVVCEPWPEGGAQRCAGDSEHFLGEPACSRIGSECPGGDFLDTFPVGRVVHHVRSGAVAGDGRRATPFGSLSEAFAVARPTDIVALAAGTYVTRGRIPAGVTVWGACVARTVLTTEVASGLPAVAVSATAGVEVRNLRIAGPRPGAAVGTTQGQLHLEDVLIDGATGVGWLAQAGGRGTGTNVVVRNTLPTPEGALGHGVWVDGASSLSGSRVVLRSNRTTSLLATGAGSRVAFSDAAVTDTLPRSDQKFGRGVDCSVGATIQLTRAALERHREVGVLVVDGATVELVDVVVRLTGPIALSQTKGHGLSVDNATLSATRLRSEENLGYAMVAGGQQARLTLEDVVLSRTGYDAVGDVGAGLAAILGAQVQLERGLLGGNVGMALVTGSGAVLTLVDLVVSDTDSRPDGRGGGGLSLVNGVTAELTRARFLRNRGTAVLVGGGGTRLTASDLDIHDTRADARKQGGAGLVVIEGAQANLVRASVAESRNSGIYLSGASSRMTAEDLSLLATKPDEEYGFSGVGFMVTEAAQLRGQRLVIDGSPVVGLWLSGPGTRAEASDVVVRGTTQPPCGGLPLCDGVLSTGVLVDHGASGALTRVLVTDNGGFGVQLVEGGELDLSEGEVSHHQLGVNNRSPGFDLSRLDDRIAYRDNGRKLDSLEVPLPTPPKPPAP